MRGTAAGVFLLFIGSLFGVWIAMTWSGVTYDPLTGILMSLFVAMVMTALHLIYYFCRLVVWAAVKVKAVAHERAHPSRGRSHVV
jgi:hypothetical protein